MTLTDMQREMARLLTDAYAAAGPGARIVYESEWLGWLPFGQYHWVGVEGAQGKDEVSRRFPSGWEMEDVLAMERAGVLRRVSQSGNAGDDEQQIVYEIAEER
jgi:hypothetical protein